MQDRNDEKLEELIAEEKGKNRGGLYFLSIAASIALVFGLFFVFKKSDVQNEMALSKSNSLKRWRPQQVEKILNKNCKR